MAQRIHAGLTSARWRNLSCLAVLAASIIIIVLRYWLPENASEEYIYTTQWVAKFILPIFILYLLYLFLTAPFFRKQKNSHIIAWLLAGGCLLAVATFFAPKPDFTPWQLDIALSLCWTASFLCLGFGFFFLGASVTGLKSGVACILGSIFLAFAIAEGYLLATPQQWDGLHYANEQSRHMVSQNVTPGFKNAGTGVCGVAAMPQGKPVSSAHRYMRYDTPIYDVRYDFDPAGRRALPRSGNPPKYDLLLFGCSFTFGAGLDNSQTWAWRLAKALGPDWQIDNYSFNGYGANQMLCFLEHNLIETPKAPKRYALFLGINDHLRRNEFFDNFPHYALDASGRPVQEGKGKYIWLNNLPGILHGSQLARQISRMGTGAIMAVKKEEAARVWLAVVRLSSQLLREKYDTRLFVMLWPDLEFMAPELEKHHIPVIFARRMLPAWDDPDGMNYQILPRYEGHPNARAGEDLANGLISYFTDLTK